MKYSKNKLLSESEQRQINQAEKYEAKKETFLDMLLGKDGEAGETGERGERGEIGLEGKRGLAGMQGETGLMGKQGPKGDKGDKGDKGEKGDDGDDGEDGRGIAHTFVSRNGDLIIDYTDGTQENSGHVQGPAGQRGMAGLSGSVISGGGGGGGGTAQPYPFVVGPVGTNALFTTIQSAVDAAELAGLRANIMVLAGVYNENVLIVNDCISLIGFTGNSSCTQLFGNLTYSPTVESVFALQGMEINGQVSVTGNQSTILWANATTINSLGGVTPLLLTNTHADSTFASRVHVRITMLDNSGPAVITDSMSLDIYNGEFRRNGNGGANATVLQMTGTASGFFKNTFLKGQARFSGSSLITYHGGAIEMSGGAACINFDAFASAVVITSTQLSTGGPLIFPTNSPSQFFYQNIAPSFNSTFLTNWGTQQGINAVVLDNSSQGDKFLANDGSYKFPVEFNGLDETTRSTTNANPSFVEYSGDGTSPTFTTPTLLAGTYRLEVLWTANITGSPKSALFIPKVDGSSILTGAISNIAVEFPAGTSNNPFSYKVNNLVLTAAAHTISLAYVAEAATGGTVTIFEYKYTLVRISD